MNNKPTIIPAQPGWKVVFVDKDGVDFAEPVIGWCVASTTVDNFGSRRHCCEPPDPILVDGTLPAADENFAILAPDGTYRTSGESRGEGGLVKAVAQIKAEMEAKQEGSVLQEPPMTMGQVVLREERSPKPPAIFYILADEPVLFVDLVSYEGKVVDADVAQIIDWKQETPLLETSVPVPFDALGRIIDALNLRRNEEGLFPFRFGPSHF